MQTTESTEDHYARLALRVRRAGHRVVGLLAVPAGEGLSSFAGDLGQRLTDLGAGPVVIVGAREAQAAAPAAGKPGIVLVDLAGVELEPEKLGAVETVLVVAVVGVTVLAELRATCARLEHHLLGVALAERSPRTPRATRTPRTK